MVQMGFTQQKLPLVSYLLFMNFPCKSQSELKSTYSKQIFIPGVNNGGVGDETNRSLLVYSNVQSLIKSHRFRPYNLFSDYIIFSPRLITTIHMKPYLYH